MKQFFTNHQGLQIHIRLDEVETTRGWVLLLHGIGDHCGRYDHVVKQFNDHALSVMRYDLQGHGQSGGLTAYVNRFEDYINDFGEVTRRMQNMIDGLPLFVVAHSMGALIAATWILDNPGVFRGAAFTGGLFKVNEDISPILQKMSALLSALVPKLKTVKLDYSRLSRDPSVLQIATNDPLHYKGGIRARTGAEVLNATAAIEPRLREWRLPTLILHGESDELTKTEASENLYNLASDEDKTLKVYPGAYHELLHEINRDEIVGDITEWITQRI